MMFPWITREDNDYHTLQGRPKYYTDDLLHSFLESISILHNIRGGGLFLVGITLDQRYHGQYRWDSFLRSATRMKYSVREGGRLVLDLVIRHGYWFWSLSRNTTRTFHNVVTSDALFVLFEKRYIRSLIQLWLFTLFTAKYHRR
jgi:hypothetical protein